MLLSKLLDTSRLKQFLGRVVLVLVVLNSIFITPAYAHHGTAINYDWDQTLVIEGIVTEFIWRNPHAALFVDITDKDASVVNYAIELGSPVQMARSSCGWTRNTFKPGDRLKFPVHPSRTGAALGVGLGQCEEVLVNGRSSANSRSSADNSSDASPLDALAQKPDLTGVWLLTSSFEGHPQSQWSSSALPFTRQGQSRFEANIPGKGPRAQMPAFGNDPLGQANPPALYRTLAYDLGRPWEFIQLENKVVQLFEWGKHWRTIWTDGRDVPEAIVAGPYWYGYSVGEWRGNTLVVRTTGLDGRAWLDGWGTPLTDLTQIEERWTLAGEDELQLTITVTDPELYAEPWTSDVITYAPQSPGSLYGELMEQIFAPIDETEFNHRVRDKVISGDGTFR